MTMPTVAAPDDASVEVLVGRIADEFTQRLNRGERPSVEEYAARHPEVASLLRQVLPSLDLLRRPDVEAAVTDADPHLGTVLGDFRVIREIGRGGMAIVYAADQLSLNRKVALKVLPYAATLDPRHLQRFKNEAAMAARLHHEHIVTVYCVGCERDVHFYAMELIEGHSLAVLIREMRRLAGLESGETQNTVPYLPTGGPTGAGPDTTPLATLTTEGSIRSPDYFRTVARLGLEAARGLEYAHFMGIRHRDIKPGNLLVDSRCNLWITDFGLAQMRSDTGLTLTGELLGTVRYMSPEQALAKRVPVDDRTDVYSLGATLYELLTLEPVFNGRDRQELLRQIAFDDPRPPRRVNAHIPRDLETIVLKALAKSPAQRYASAGELAEDLRLFLDNQPIKARREGLLRWLGRKSRRYAAGILLGLSAVITTVVLFLLFWHLNKPTPEEIENQRQQQALAALTQDLDGKKKVTLIGERGRPGYYRLKTDTTVAQLVDAPDGAFRVQDWDTGLVELLPDTHLERYRFSAELRHERRTNQEARVGIYFAHSEQRDGKTVTHFHCNLTFNDWDSAGPGATKNTVGLQIHRQPLEGPPGDKSTVLPTHEFDPPGVGGKGGIWRKMAVEVRPDNVKLCWEGACFYTLPRADLMRKARRLVARPDQPLPANAPQYEPRGGIGLFVSLGIASFRNVTVEPIGDDN